MRNTFLIYFLLIIITIHFFSCDDAKEANSCFQNYQVKILGKTKVEANSDDSYHNVKDTYHEKIMQVEVDPSNPSSGEMLTDQITALKSFLMDISIDRAAYEKKGSEDDVDICNDIYDKVEEKLIASERNLNDISDKSREEEDQERWEQEIRDAKYKQYEAVNEETEQDCARKADKLNSMLNLYGASCSASEIRGDQRSSAIIPYKDIIEVQVRNADYLIEIYLIAFSKKKNLISQIAKDSKRSAIKGDIDNIANLITEVVKCKSERDIKVTQVVSGLRNH